MISGATSLTGGSGRVSIALPSVQVTASRAVAGLHELPALWPGSGAASAAHEGPRLPEVNVGPARRPAVQPAEATPEIAVSTTEDGVRFGPKKTKVSYDVAFDRIAATTARMTGEIERMQDLAREQSRAWHKASVYAAVVGMGLVAAAVIVLLKGNVTTGIATSIAGLVPNTLAGIFFVTGKRLDKRVDDLTKGLTEYREAAALVEIAQTIEDKQLRDGIKVEIVRKVLQKKG